MKKIPTLEEAMETYIEKRSIKATTAFNYRRNIRHCCKDWLAMPVTEITKGMIIERHQEASIYSPKTADFTFRVLRAMALWSGVTPFRNAVMSLNRDRLWNYTAPRQDDSIGTANIQKWFWALRDVEPAPRDLLLVLLLTGLRQDTLAGLRVDDIDFNRALLLTLQGTHPMSNWVCQILWLRSVDNLGLVFGGLERPYRAIHRVTKHTGLDFTARTLRATFETLAMAAGVSEPAIAKYKEGSERNDPEESRHVVGGVALMLADLSGISRPAAVMLADEKSAGKQEAGLWA